MFNVLDPLGSLLDWMVDGAVEAWKTSASWALTAGGMGEDEWSVAFDLVNKVAGVMSFVAVGVGAIGILAAAARSKPGDMVMAFFRTILAWPLTAGAVSLVAKGVAVSSALTTRILAWAWPDSSGGISLPGMDGGKFKSIPGGSVTVILLALLIALGSVVLMLAMAARTVLIILGVGFAAIPIMSGAWGALKASLNRWGSWILGIILFQPVCAVVIYLAGRLMESNADSVGSYLTAVVCIILACLFPWALVKIIAQFLPGEPGLAVAAGAAKASVDTGKQVVETAVKIGAAAVSMGAGAMGAAGAGGAAGASGASSGAKSFARAAESVPASGSSDAKGYAGRAAQAFSALADAGGGSKGSMARGAATILSALASPSSSEARAAATGSAEPASSAAFTAAQAGVSSPASPATTSAEPSSSSSDFARSEAGETGVGSAEPNAVSADVNVSVDVASETGGITVARE